MRVTTSLVEAINQYTLPVTRQVNVGEVARYLSQQEAAIDASTLEIAYKLKVDDQFALQDINYQPGDRLLIFMQAPKPTQLPEALAPGDKILKFSRGNFEVSSGSKKKLLIGKATDEVNPDVDLRNFVSQRYLEYVSRRTLEFEFDTRAKVWYARRIGSTRIGVGDTEIEDAPYPIDTANRLRLYRGNDDPRNPASPVLGEIHIQVEVVQSQRDVIILPAGDQQQVVCAGSEPTSLTLEISETVPLGKLVNNVLAHKQAQSAAGLYLVRLVAPDLRMDDSDVRASPFLYTVRHLHQAQNTLILRDIRDERHKFELLALDGEERVIGRRSQPGQTEAELDVDLYEVLVNQAANPDAYRSISRRQARVFFRNNAWLVQVESGTQVPLFVNSVRVNSVVPTPLASGDVLSFGPTVEDYCARLIVDIAARVS